MRFGLSPVDVQGDGRLLNPAPLREGFGPSYDALRLLFCVCGVSWLSQGGRSCSHRPIEGPCRLSCGFHVARWAVLGRVCRLRCVACALLRSAGLLVFRRMSAPARECLSDLAVAWPARGVQPNFLQRRDPFRFRAPPFLCRWVTGAGPCGLFILLRESGEGCGRGRDPPLW